MLTDDIEYNERVLEDRNNQIESLCGDIISLNEMFQDVSLMVKDQDTAVNTIANNIESSSSYTAKANTEIEVTERRRKSKCCSWFCCC
tara:strand:- start:85 stop:348 length:264 start_codon:yes stop_codon:yes gene_type:complete